MTELQRLVDSVEQAREAVLEATASWSAAQGAFAPDDAWSASEVVEHLYLAEMTGVTKIWTAADAHRAGRGWTGERPHAGKPIEQVVAETWKPREVAPPIAAPQFGAPLACGRSALRSLRPVLADLAAHLADLPLEAVVFPHPLSGPLDARQRLAFLRFHLERHLAQIQRIREHPGFPG